MPENDDQNEPINEVNSYSIEDDNDFAPLISKPTSSSSNPVSRKCNNHENSVYHGFEGMERNNGRVIILGLSLCSILAVFWLLDSLKDAVFASLVGMEYQPTAKFLSVLSTLLLVLWLEYGLGSTSVKGSTRIFYVVGVPYFIAFMIISSCLREYKPSNEESLTKGWRLLGYLSYIAIESFGSMMVATFWAYTNQTLDLETAKKSYGIIVAIAQVGAITGSSIATSVQFLGLPMLFIIGAIGILVTLLFVSLYAAVYPPHAPREKCFTYDADDQDEVDSTKSVSVSGIHLILRHNYLLLVLGLSCLYEIVLTVIDYEMKLIGLAFIGAKESSSSASEEFAKIMGSFGVTTNCISLLVSFFGFGYLVRKIGQRKTLLVYPSLLLVGVFISFLLPHFWLLFAVMSVLKASTYSIFDPCKELLYVPTSNAVKFKAKFWIDVVGARCAKALGSSINNMSNADSRQLIQYGWIPSVLISFLILLLSMMAGKEFDKIVESGYIVGEDDDDCSKDENKEFMTELRVHEYDENDWLESEGGVSSGNSSANVLTI